MSDYICINKSDRGGELAISRKVFVEIAKAATKRALKENAKGEAEVIEPIKVVFRKDDRVIVKIRISVKKGNKPTDISVAIQKEVAHALEAYVESVPFEIEVSVAEIK